jgi:alpha-1,6-mannosyltransferase
MASLGVAAVVYLLAVREIFTAKKLSRWIVVVGLLLSAVWHIAFLRLPVGTDDDIHRYVWDGRLQRLGHNPYVVIPGDPAVQALHTAETRNLNNPDLPSPYPAGAQFFFRAIAAIRESTFAFKVAFVICDWAIVIILLDILRRTRKKAHLVLAYAWNPLLAIEVAGSGHIDIVGALLLVVSVAALMRRWRTTAAVAFGLAVAVKFLPIVLLPLYWKRVRIRDTVLAVAVVALLYAPFVTDSRISTGSLGTYVQGFRFNGPVFAIFHQVASAPLLAALAVLVGLVTATWLIKTKPEFPLQLVAWPMAASLLFAPVVFPWYLLWLLPFLMFSSTLPMIVWTVSIIPVYVMWHFRAQGRPWGSLPAWAMVVEYGFVAAVGAFTVLRRSTQRAALVCPRE